MHVRRNDTVVLVKDITGNPDSPKGKRGRVLKVFPDRGKVIVEGVAYRYRHTRRSRDNRQGGRVQKEAVIDASNVLVLCPQCDRGVRTGTRPTDEGKKMRVCRKCGSEIPVPH